MWVDNRFIASDKLPRAINKSQFRNQLHIKYRLLEFSVLAIIDVYTLKLYNFSMIEQKTKFSRVNKSLAFWVNNTIFSIWKKKGLRWKSSRMRKQRNEIPSANKCVSNRYADKTIRNLCTTKFMTHNMISRDSVTNEAFTESAANKPK